MILVLFDLRQFPSFWPSCVGTTILSFFIFNLNTWAYLLILFYFYFFSYFLYAPMVHMDTCQLTFYISRVVSVGMAGWGISAWWQRVKWFNAVHYITLLILVYYVCSWNFVDSIFLLLHCKISGIWFVKTACIFLISCYSANITGMSSTQKLGQKCKTLKFTPT